MERDPTVSMSAGVLLDSYPVGGLGCEESRLTQRRQAAKKAKARLASPLKNRSALGGLIPVGEQKQIPRGARNDTEGA